jgi:hypothetical protein
MSLFKRSLLENEAATSHPYLIKLLNRQASTAWKRVLWYREIQFKNSLLRAGGVAQVAEHLPSKCEA